MLIKKTIKEIEEEIEFLRKQFKVLRGWCIEYHSRGRYRGQCCWNIDTKEAIIYKFRKGDNLMPDDYLVHEMLHIALSAVYNGKTKDEEKREEKVIRAICGLIFGEDKKNER